MVSVRISFNYITYVDLSRFPSDFVIWRYILPTPKYELSDLERTLEQVPTNSFLKKFHHSQIKQINVLANFTPADFHKCHYNQ